MEEVSAKLLNPENSATPAPIVWSLNRKCCLCILFLLPLAGFFIFYDVRFFENMRDLLNDTRSSWFPSEDPYEKGAVAVVTVVTANFGSKYDPHWRRAQEYCRIHNYTCMRFTGGERRTFANSRFQQTRDMPKFWRKLMVVDFAFKSYEYIVWLDADNFILDTSLRIEDLFVENHIQIVFSGSPHFSSSHLFALRHGSFSKAFLDLWWKRRSYFKANCHYDQGPFLHAMIELTIQYLFTGTKRIKALNKLGECKNFVYEGVSLPRGRTPCNSYQSCLGSLYNYWLRPLVWSSRDNETANALANLPFTWPEKPHWRHIGWNDEIRISLQGNKKSVFENCDSAFSVHPVKQISQLQLCNQSYV